METGSRTTEEEQVCRTLLLSGASLAMRMPSCMKLVIARATNRSCSLFSLSYHRTNRISMLFLKKDRESLHPHGNSYRLTVSSRMAATSPAFL